MLITNTSSPAVPWLADVMYVEEAIPALVESLVSLSQSSTEIYIAHGRNRQAEAKFKHTCAGSFRVTHLARRDMDNVYQTIDVDVLKLCKIDVE